jgi:hypothetical protein
MERIEPSFRKLLYYHHNHQHSNMANSTAVYKGHPVVPATETESSHSANLTGLVNTTNPLDHPLFVGSSPSFMPTAFGPLTTEVPDPVVAPTVPSSFIQHKPEVYIQQLHIRNSWPSTADQFLRPRLLDKS